VPCGACGKPVRGGDEFCETCGARVSDDLKRVLRQRLEASHGDYAEHAKKLRSAQTTILVLSVLFLVSGVIFFFITRAQAEQAAAGLGSASDAALLQTPVEGATTAGELRSLLERQPWQVLSLNVFLAVVMLGLWIWSKRSVLAAVITALGIYVMVVVANGLYDPATLAQGIIMKIFILLALARGVQSTLAARKLELAR
jgi:hypothetical protein